MMRRLLFGMVSMFLLSVVLIGSASTADAQPAAVLDSGALGLTRAEIESDFGPSGEPIEVPGHPSYDETYAYETQLGTLFVTYRDVDSAETAVYLEFAWRGDGVGEPDARTLVEGFLPSDAKLTELYTAPPTSSGPIALVTNRYESATLGGVTELAPEILVIYQERWGDPAAVDSTRVQSVSIMIRERTQLNG